ncbi:sigma-54-dependent transcriptional regulator [Hyunsoonleella pacifica]|uniref:sigma-54-dependent transcriptional regulator n=1 Tax=Hyunsoonleella pacifica TaxID=1080224 RepID=UPI0019C2EFFC|nr:sigma-54 dependent transcriptional regulator [Hyunsoonleella pacifica]GGD04316.1 sigma-54-dependent Fis family transcriptional regulator [Hyunsoonleella pacifica]
MLQSGKILIVDDNKGVLSALELLLQDVYKTVTTLQNPNGISSVTDLKSYDVILLDMNFSSRINTGNEGFYWLRKLKEIVPDASVIMMTAFGDVELAVNTLKEGAIDFVLKPWDNEKILATIHAAFQLGKSKKEVNLLKQSEKKLKHLINETEQQIIGTSSAINAVLKITEKVAKTSANVLITGENGTGKELIARAIHNQSAQHQEILVNVDVSAIPESLFESELFGHVKGAFTDAKNDRAGKFEVAHNGTLFLDEIGNLPLQLQSKLLKVIQQKEIVRIGSNKVIPVNVRLVCATNCDLNKMVDEGLFREDLLYRINTIHIEVPSLRERSNDIIELAEFFLNKYANKYDKKGLKLSSAIKKKLLKYTWPGNIRELQHTMERCVILSENNLLTVNDFMFNQRQTKALNTADITIDEMEKNMIITALKKHDGNYSTAAKQLGITRQTLYNKTKRYKI